MSGGGFSSSEGSSRPVDLTPPEFEALRQPFADVVAGLLGFGTGPGHVPTGDPNDPLRGIPGYEGPLVAPMTRGEDRLLSGLRHGNDWRRSTARTAAKTGFDNSYNKALDPWRMGNLMVDPSQMTIDELDFETGAYDRAANPFAGMDFGTDNPFFHEAVTAAQRSTMQNLEETLDRTLPSMFTRGGQMIQYDPERGVGGSSAFNRAAAIATRGATQEMGDIAAEMSFQAWDAERNRELAAIDAQQNRILESISQDRSLEAQFQNEELMRQHDALEGQKQRLMTATMNERQMQFQGAESRRERMLQGVQLGQQEVQTTIQNLQAQALPRLIEDLGIERGMEQFNNKMNALMILLQTAGGVGSPTVSNVSNQESLGVQKPGF